MMTLIEHATTVLSKADKPFTSQEIVAKYTPPKGGKTPHDTLTATISVQKDRAPIQKVGTNQYWLKARMSELDQKNIEVLAYDLWEKAAKPVSDGVEFWLVAEKLYEAQKNQLTSCCKRVSNSCHKIYGNLEEP